MNTATRFCLPAERGEIIHDPCFREASVQAIVLPAATSYFFNSLEGQADTRLRWSALIPIYRLHWISRFTKVNFPGRSMLWKRRLGLMANRGGFKSVEVCHGIIIEHHKGGSQVLFEMFDARRAGYEQRVRCVSQQPG